MFQKKAFKFFKHNFLIFIILALAFLIRIYRLPVLTTFSGDQGIDLLVIKNMIVNHKLVLLGPKTSILGIYNGPFYYYLILPALFIFKLNPMSISYFMVLMWILAIYITYLIGEKAFNKNIGLFSALLFSIWPLGIEYSRVSFNSFPTPLFSSIFLYGIWKYYLIKEAKWMILSGIVFGFMMQLHYFNVFVAFLSFVFLLNKKKLSPKGMMVFALSFVIGFLPMILFELRHNFFNTRTLLFSLSHSGLGNFNFQIHYLISFIPVIFLMIGWTIAKILKANKYFGIIIFTILIYLNVSRIDLSRNNGFTMPDGWNYLGVKRVSEIITKDVNGPFEVAAILDGDTRAYPYRYIIESMGKYPMEVSQYDKANTLYLVARDSRENVFDYPVWEIQAIKPARITKTWKIQNGISLYKIEKETKK